MKNPTPPAFGFPAIKALSSRHRIASLLAGAAVLGTAPAATWSGATSTAWNTATNWIGGVPNASTATINTIPANVPRITVNPTGTPTDIIIGNATGDGRLDHTGGTASTGTTNNLLVGTLGGTGRYHLANVDVAGAGISGSGQGSGSMNARNRFYVGGSLAGANAADGIVYINTTGTLAVTSLFEVGTAGATGVINLEAGTVTANDWVYFGDGAAGSGTLNMTGGTFTKTGGNHFVVANNGSTGSVDLSGTGAITVNNETWVGNGAGSAGSLTLAGSGILTSNNNVSIGRAAGTGNVVMSGGTWTKTGAGNFVIGANGPGSMTQSGGLVDVQTGTTYIGEQAAATTVTLTVSGTAEFRTASFFVGVSSPNATLNLNGGTVKTGQLSGGSGDETVNFNGTRIIATAVVPANAAIFISSFDTAVVGTDGLLIDSNGFNLGVAQDLEGSGGVVKTGEGTVTLTGGNTHTGLHTVTAGKLISNTSSTGSGDFAVADGAGMGVIQQNPNDSLAVSNVVFGTSAATSLDIDLGNFIGNTTVAPLNVTGALTLNGEVTLNLTDALPAIGEIPLVTYVAPKGGSGGFVLGTLPPGVDATLADDGAGVVSITVHSISLPVWDGTHDGVWDTATANWIDELTGLSVTYSDPNPVLFDDDATGTTEVTLDVAVAPYSVDFNNSTDAYSVTGSGKITGSGGLRKQGIAALTLGTANEYTGPTLLEGGTISVNSIANGGSPSAIGASSAAASNLILNGAILEYTGPAADTDRGLTIGGFDSGIRTANDLTISGPIASTGGNLLKSGAGNLTFSSPGANAFGPSGQGIRVQAGTLTFSGSGTQTNAVAGELWVAETPDVPAHLVLDHTSLTTTSWLAIGRGNGDAGECSLIANNSTIQTVNFSTGFDNGLANNASEQTVTLNNTVWTNNGLTYLAESAGSTATMTLNGTSRYDINNNFLLARFTASTHATVNLTGTSSITKTGGYSSVGNEGTAVMNVRDGASFTATTGDFNIGDVGTSNGTLNLSGSGTVNVTNVYIGKNFGTAGTFTQSGGTFASGAFISIGRSNGSTGIVNVSGGSFTASTQLLVAEGGTGTLTLSGTGGVTVNGSGILVSNGPTGNGTLNLDGGTLTTKQLIKGGSGTGTVNFNGGLLRAATGATTNFLSGLNAANLLAAGARIDTNGNTVTASQVLTGAGGLTKSGAGTLTLSGANNYTGPTVVSGGTLSVSSAWFADTSAITIAPGAVLNLPHGATDVVASLTIGTTVIGTGKIQVSGAVSPYDAWAASYGLNPLTDGAPGFDKDNDGEPNSVEFALGGSPVSGSNRAKTFVIVADSSADGDALKELLITIAVRTGTPAFSGNPSPAATKDGYTCTIQGGTTLGSFPTVVTPVAVVVPPAPNATPPAGYEWRTFSLSGSNGTPGKGFLRVSVTP